VVRIGAGGGSDRGRDNWILRVFGIYHGELVVSTGTWIAPFSFREANCRKHCFAEAYCRKNRF
jgi:hypothetical protein